MSTLLPPRPASPRQLEWLDAEARAWEASGLLQQGQAAAILASYQVTRRFTIARLLLGLGAAFVGVGLIWLVGVNLDQLPPAARVVVVGSVFLVTLVAAESLALRWQDVVPNPVVAALRLVAAFAWGATVLQAAFSFDVDIEPWLFAVWGAGALLYGYLRHAAPPLLVGVGALAGWWFGELGPEDPTALALVIAMGVAATICLALAAVHERWSPSLAVPWREVGAGIALVMLFVAAMPTSTREDFAWDAWLVGGPLLAAVAFIAAGAGAQESGRLEPLGALVASLVAVVLVLWEAGADVADPVTVVDWLHAGVSVAAYVALAGGVAVLGTIRDSWRLTALATVALVGFTTVQAFEVFGVLVEGAWLFVVLGTVFLLTGYLFDRARRRFAASLEQREGTNDVNGVNGMSGTPTPA